MKVEVRHTIEVILDNKEMALLIKEIEEMERSGLGKSKYETLLVFYNVIYNNWNTSVLFSEDFVEKMMIDFQLIPLSEDEIYKKFPSLMELYFHLKETLEEIK